MIIILEFGKKLKLWIKYIWLLLKKKLLNQKPSFHVIPCANKEKAWEFVYLDVYVEVKNIVQ